MPSRRGTSARPRPEALVFGAADRTWTRDEAEAVLAIVARHLHARCAIAFEHALDVLGPRFEARAFRALLHARGEPRDGELAFAWAGVVAATEAVDGCLAYGVFLFPFVGNRRVEPHGGSRGRGRYRYVAIARAGEGAVVDDLGWQEDEWDEWSHVETPRDLLNDPTP